MRAKLKLNILISLLTVVGLVAKVEARTVNVAVPTLSMVVIAFTAAKEKGYYQEEGLDVNLVVMRDTLGISALIGGNADFASMSGAGFTAILGGMPLRFVFSSFFRPMFWLYAKPEFQDVKALKGKRIGVTGLGSGPDNLLRETLKRNGMEGGRVLGHDAVRAYWTRQFQILDPHVEPKAFTAENDVIVVDVEQVVHEKSGKLLVNQMIQHVYQFRDGLVWRMDIRAV